MGEWEVCDGVHGAIRSRAAESDHPASEPVVERRRVYDPFGVVEFFRRVGVVISGKLKKPENHGVCCLGNQELQLGGCKIIVQPMDDRHP
jgi:hypothetical protein